MPDLHAEDAMIGFRDEEPTFAQSAIAAAEHLEGTDKGRCRACNRLAVNCDVVGTWCFGRTARASHSNPELRAEFVEQLERVVAMQGWWPKSVEYEKEAAWLVKALPGNGDTFLIGQMMAKFPDSQPADLIAALWKVLGRE